MQKLGQGHFYNDHCLSTHLLVLEQRVGHIRLGHSTHKKVREPYVRAKSIEELWARLHETAAPNSLCRELGVMGQAMLDHRTQLTGTHLNLVVAGA